MIWFRSTESHRCDDIAFRYELENKHCPRIRSVSIVACKLWARRWQGRLGFYNGRYSRRQYFCILAAEAFWSRLVRKPSLSFTRSRVKALLPLPTKQCDRPRLWYRALCFEYWVTPLHYPVGAVLRYTTVYSVRNLIKEPTVNTSQGSQQHHNLR